VQTAINQVGWAFNRFLHSGDHISNLVLHLITNEKAQFICNQKGKAIAGGCALVERSRIQKMLEAKKNEPEPYSNQDETAGTIHKKNITQVRIELIVN
jgi:hypothetical protein